MTSHSSCSINSSLCLHPAGLPCRCWTHQTHNCMNQLHKINFFFHYSLHTTNSFQLFPLLLLPGESSLIRLWYQEWFLRNKILRMDFLNWFCCLWNWFSGLIRFKACNDSISVVKRTLRIHGAMQQQRSAKCHHWIQQISTYRDNTFKHFCQSAEYNKIGWLLLNALK